MLKLSIENKGKIPLLIILMVSLFSYFLGSFFASVDIQERYFLMSWLFLNIIFIFCLYLMKSDPDAYSSSNYFISSKMIFISPFVFLLSLFLNITFDFKEQMFFFITYFSAIFSAHRLSVYYFFNKAIE